MGMLLFRLLMAPFAGVWSLVLRIRHTLYDWELIKSHRFSFPVIVLGNLTVGGTGKTPHSIYVVRLLKQHGILPALLSRGYGRRTMGYREVLEHELPALVGDEPLLMKHRLGDTLVYVDEDRVHGIHGIKQHHPEVGAVVLDDAYQHRRLVPGVSIVLMRRDRPTHTDFLLPMGKLRDIRERLYEADAVVITHCPDHLSHSECLAWRKDLALRKGQKLFFSTLVYRPAVRLTDGQAYVSAQGEAPLLAVTAIAHPEAFLNRCKQIRSNVYPLIFPDHSPFDPPALQRLQEKWETLDRPDIMMTEKDAVKLRRLLPDSMLQCAYVLPIDIQFLKVSEQEADFDQWLLSTFGDSQTNH